MNNSSVIKISLGLAIFLVVLSTGMALYSLNKFMEQSRLSEELRTEIKTLFDIKYATRDAISKVRGYVITGHTPFLEEYRKNRARARQSYQQLQAMLAGEEEKLKQLDKINSSVTQRLQVLDDVLAAYAANNLQQVKTRTIYGFVITKAIDENMALLEKQNAAELARIRQSREQYQQLTVAVTLVSYLLSFLFIFIAFRAYRRANRAKQQAYYQLELKNGELNTLNTTLDERVKQRTAELERKNRELNLYAEQLKNSYEDLEVKIKFRTLELEKSIHDLQQENNALKGQTN